MYCQIFAQAGVTSVELIEMPMEQPLAVTCLSPGMSLAGEALGPRVQALRNGQKQMFPFLFLLNHAPRPLPGIPHSVSTDMNLF